WLADAVFAVSDDIAAWERRSGVRPEKITVQTNFVDEPTDGQLALDLPGQPGQRVVVVANLRPEKNHLRLIRAFATVVESAPDVHLLVVGSQANVDHTARIRAEIDHMGLGHQVSLLGVRGDVPAILAACDVAVLPSLDEGFPLALIEYGLAGLPVVATPVGQVPEATADGALAVLIDPLDARALASALIELLADEGRRRRLGQEFSALVRSRYSAEAVLPDIVDRYESLLSRPKAQRGVRR
ncbi:MAG: glycosyltransferase family 4 protein, partial [Aquihabitans sp.]